MNNEIRRETGESRETQQLRAEVQRLQKELETRQEGALGGRSTRRSAPFYRRGGLVVTILIIGLVILAMTIPVLWVRQTLLTTDGWVTASAPLADSPAMQESIAEALTRRFTQQVDIEAWVRRRLPPQSAALAAPLSVVVTNSVRQAAEGIVQSDLFAGLWREANRLGHRLLPAAMQRMEGAQDLRVDLTAMLQRLQEALAERGLEFTVPEGARGEVTLLRSEQISGLLVFTGRLETAAIWLTFLTVAALGGTIALAQDRRRAVWRLGIGIAVTGLVLVLADWVMMGWLTGQVPPDAALTSEAAGEAYDAFTGGLTSSIRAAVILGIILALGAYVLGPAPAMVRARAQMLDYIHESSGHRQPRRWEVWVGAHRHAIQIGVLIVAAVVLVLPAQRTVGMIIALTVTVVLVEFLVEFFARTTPTSHT